MEKIKISRIQIEIGNTVLSLTIEEAKELKRILNDTFPEKTITLPYQPPIIHPAYPCRPAYPYWSTSYSNGTLGISAKGGNCEKLASE